MGRGESRTGTCEVSPLAVAVCSAAPPLFSRGVLEASSVHVCDLIGRQRCVSVCVCVALAGCVDGTGATGTCECVCVCVFELLPVAQVGALKKQVCLTLLPAGAQEGREGAATHITHT